MLFVCSAMSRCYNFGPTFRADSSSDRTHQIRYFWNLLGTLSLFTGEEKQFLHVYQHWNFSYLVRRWYSFSGINRDQRKLLISFSIANSMVFEFGHYYYYVYPIFGSNSKLDNQDNEFLSKNSHRRRRKVYGNQVLKWLRQVKKIVWDSMTKWYKSMFFFIVVKLDAKNEWHLFIKTLQFFWNQ
jgi:hypothetical protein